MKIQRSPRVLLLLLAIALPGGVLLLLLPLMNGLKSKLQRNPIMLADENKPD